MTGIEHSTFPCGDEISERLKKARQRHNRRMCRIALGVAFLWASAILLGATLAHAQEAAKTFTLTVTNQDLQVLSAALDELPRKVSEPVVEKLQQQLVGQMQAATPPAASPASAPASEPKPVAPAEKPPFDPKAHPSF